MKTNENETERTPHRISRTIRTGAPIMTNPDGTTRGEPMLTQADCLRPGWHVSPRVRALVTTRSGGVSLPPYGRWSGNCEMAGGLNLGLHTGDDPTHVECNRGRLLSLAGVRAAWL